MENFIHQPIRIRVIYDSSRVSNSGLRRRGGGDDAYTNRHPLESSGS